MRGRQITSAYEHQDGGRWKKNHQDLCKIDLRNYQRYPGAEHRTQKGERDTGKGRFPDHLCVTVEVGERKCGAACRLHLVGAKGYVGWKSVCKKGWKAYKSSTSGDGVDKPCEESGQYQKCQGEHHINILCHSGESGNPVRSLGPRSRGDDIFMRRIYLIVRE